MEDEKPEHNSGISIVYTDMILALTMQPVEVAKVRVQLGQGGEWQMGLNVARTMLKNEGIRSFYKGFSTYLLRQATYSTARFGAFRFLTNKALEANDGKPLPFCQNTLCVLIPSAIEACVASPIDLALTRMQSDAALCAPQCIYYRNTFYALYRITADEGVMSVLKGVGPTVSRVVAFGIGLMLLYKEQCRKFFKVNTGLGEITDDIAEEVVSTVPFLFAAACSKPFDYVKTQIQKMKPDIHGKYPYTGSIDCVKKTIMSGGISKFYRGYSLYAFRIIPVGLMTIHFLEQIEKMKKQEWL